MLQVTISGKPQSMPRPRVSKYGSYIPRSKKAALDTVIAWLKTAKELQNWTCTDQPVHVSIQFVHNRPKKLAGTGRVPKGTRPDIDNLAKFYLDALTKAGIWTDDSLVCSLVLTDFYGTIHEKAHVVIQIREF